MKMYTRTTREQARDATIPGSVAEDEDVHKDDQRLGHGRYPFIPYLGVLQKMKMYTMTTRD
jgi:hypothetical protein